MTAMGVAPRLRPALLLWIGLGLSFAASCVQVDPRPDYDRARRLFEESTGRSEVFDPLAPNLPPEELDAILADGLSLDEALRVALLNNFELHAEFQEIGIAHADWVQSQLLTNPSLDFLLRFPAEGGRWMLEAIVGLELLELWRIPVRQEVARERLEATVLCIARRAGELTLETRAAYCSAAAAEQLRMVAQERLELASRSFEAVRDMRKAGAADGLDENLAQGPLLFAQLALMAARLEVADARRTLAKKLSLQRSLADLLLLDALPLRLPALEDFEVLVKKAMASRLDLRAMEAAIRALDSQVRLEERRAWGELAAGPTVERPAGSGGELIGPALSLTLPVFDQNQAQIARAGFKLQRMVKLHGAMQVGLTQDLRAAVERMNAAAKSLDLYAHELLPRAERSLALARDSYAAGQASLLVLLEAQRQVLEVQSAHVTLRLEAALSTAELARIVGAPLDG
ncbi:MAG TPA: TolC family protein [Planctomycetes bacterium]|jgi:outer membrane protein, heavy metal efflux system|nr:TolC family protein [Planctomycetota bacterium]